MYKKLILGSPGTGKTTRLLQITENKLQTIRPERIAFFSFTKKAVTEAKDRAASKFNIPVDRLKNFKTLHALCYRELGLNHNKVINQEHLETLAGITGVRILGVNPSDDEVVEKGDQFIFLESYARLVKKTAQKIWSERPLDVSWLELKLFIDTYNAYKAEHKILDYTDMLYNYTAKGDPLNIDIAIIDEAQDLSPLQWDVVNQSIMYAKEVYIAGDDDQAIYKWSGADIDTFLNLDVTEKEVLPISYRLPKEIFTFANNIAERIKHRYEKEWTPQEKAGKVFYHSSLDKVDFNGNWLILVRSNRQLLPIRTYLKEHGYLFITKGYSSIKEEHKDLILAYVAYQNGRFVKPLIMNVLKKYYDDGLEWYDALTNISFYDREYYRSILRRGMKLSDEPTIQLSTVHGSKGGECDNVLLLTDLPKQVYDTYMQDSDDEHRVFYVAATRAKNELHVLTPQTEMNYEL